MWRRIMDAPLDVQTTCQRDSTRATVDPSVAVGLPAVFERRRARRHEAPAVPAVTQDQPEDAERRLVPGPAVRLNAHTGVMAAATGADHELPNALWVWRRPPVLWGEPLVAVIVAVDHDLGTCCVERLPQAAHLVLVAVLPRAEERVVPVRHHTGARMRGQVGPQPAFLRRPHPAAADLGAVRVQRVHAPGASVIGIPAPVRVAGRRSEVAEVPRRAGRLVLVVARCGARPRRMPAPARPVAGAELPERAAFVGVVAGGEDGSREAVQHLGGLLVAG